MQNLFVFIVKYKASINQVELHLEAHREFLRKGYERKILLASGAQVPRKGGVIIAKFKSLDEAKDFIKDDPFYMHEIAEYEVFEFMPTLYDTALKSFL